MMNTVEYDKQTFPPHLAMDEYADFLSENVKSAGHEQIRIQNEIEERITKRFCVQG